jgi:hypothetical protein
MDFEQGFKIDYKFMLNYQMKVNNELDKTYKELVTAQFKVLSSYFN